MALSLWRHVRQRLSIQVVVVMVAILLLTAVSGFIVMYRNTSGQLNDQFEHRSLSIAQTLAGEQNVVALAAHGRPGGQLQALAGQV
jgi:sensor histidine kinase regulating citrate/malate metabolism